MVGCHVHFLCDSLKDQSFTLKGALVWGIAGEYQLGSVPGTRHPAHTHTHTHKPCISGVCKITLGLQRRDGGVEIMILVKGLHIYLQHKK